MFLADLHIHSHYARATSRQLVPEMLALWGRRKGLGVIGTGDFTHPGWRTELADALIEAEPGLYRLRPELAMPDDWHVPHITEPRFVLSCEISSIYKKHGKVRKVHNVLLMPGLSQAEAFSKRLERIGNLHSDGRPILGLDSRDLLEIALECCPEVVFIPAHIWTPHFSLFGAYSGFDTIEECFEDLTPHIHALETGLSSDPAMNWRLSALDGYTLVSNSDAHSPTNLAREANIFDCGLSYADMRQALAHPDTAGFGGTLEFFPEEGKYHLDGHRICKVCLSPQETNELGGVCPVCGQKITVGVLHRVDELADRPEGSRPKTARHYESLIPLPEVIASTLGVGPNSVKVQRAYQAALSALGPELSILRQVPPEDIEQAAGPLVAESIRRLRSGSVEMQPGYDGEYGKVKILTAEEIAKYSGQMSFLPGGVAKAAPKKPRKTAKKAAHSLEMPDKGTQSALPDPHYGLNKAQWEAVSAKDRAIAVSAGPGTGKTRTLICRILHLIKHAGVHPSQITAVTFTNKAAKEMRQRLSESLPNAKDARAVHIGTFHALCHELLTKWKVPFQLAEQSMQQAVMAECLQSLAVKGNVHRFLEAVSRRKNGLPAASDTPLTDDIYYRYTEQMQAYGLADYDDLLLLTLQGFTGAHKRDKAALRMFHHLLVDEFQDINDLQYRLIQAWGEKSASLFVIGDPDQSIYGFRGSSAQCFARFASDHPALHSVHLSENYRSAPEILFSALPIVHRESGYLHANCSPMGRVQVLRAKDEFDQALYIAKHINRLVGGIGMLEAHRQGARQASYGFGDIAILYRTHRQAQQIEHCLKTEGIPYTVSGRESYLNESDVRAALSYLRLLLCPQDRYSLQTCLMAFGVPLEQIRAVSPTDGASLSMALQALGLSHLASLMEAQFPKAAKAKPAALLDALIPLLGQSEALSMLRGAALGHATAASLLDALAFGSEGDITRASGAAYPSEAVSLMTLHGAKGLEFPVVFLCGMQEGMLPLIPPKGICDEEEERRLLYVGMTRAKDQLYLLCPDPPSPFLALLPKSQLCFGTARETRPSSGKQLSMF